MQGLLVTTVSILNAQGNVIASVAHLATLTALRRLALDRNRLASVARLAPLSTLCRLTHLALASNGVASLAPLAALTALVELYAPDNRLASTRALAALQVRRVADPVNGVNGCSLTWSDTLLEGSVERHDDSMRVCAELRKHTDTDCRRAGVKSIDQSEVERGAFLTQHAMLG